MLNIYNIYRNDNFDKLLLILNKPLYKHVYLLVEQKKWRGNN